MKYLYKIYYYFLFKIKDPKKVINHPRHNKPIEFGFTVGDKHYYRLKHDYDIFENRFRYLTTFYQEVQNKLTSSDINEFAGANKKYLQDYKISIHKGNPKPELLDKAIQLDEELEYRSTWLFEPTSLYKYASVLYFDLQEDITDYDMMYCNKKIEYWSKKKGLLRMLLKELMTNVNKLLSLSSNDFNHYISGLQKAKDKQQKLISDSGLTSNKKSIDVMI